MIIPSLKWRLAIAVSLLLIAVIISISVVSYVEFREAQLNSVDHTLLVMTNAIAANLNNTDSQEDILDEIRSITGQKYLTFPVLYRVWFEGSKNDLCCSDPAESKYGQWLQTITDKLKVSQGNYSFGEIFDGAKAYRVVWLRDYTGQKPVNIVVAISSRFAYHEMKEFMQFLVIFGFCVVTGAIVATLLIVSWGTRSINQAAGQLQNITMQNLNLPILTEGSLPREVQPFADAVNAMLIRLHKATKKQKQFTADASHELRTPLTVAKSTLQTARMRPRSKDAYITAIDDTLEDITKMESLIDQLLTLARQDNSSAIPDFVSVQLDRLLIDLIEQVKRAEPTIKDRIVIKNFSQTMIKGIPDNLNILFGNILNNAIKYSTQPVAISVSMAQDSDGHISVSIHNRGQTIAKEKLPHLFDRFFRGDNSRSNQIGGTGLGLAIALEIARQHGGNIRIEPCLSPEGTTVVVTLPFER